MKDTERTNIFAFENMDHWRCRVVEYSAPSILRIEIQDIDGNSLLYALFSAVMYYCGPVSWEGAQFDIGSTSKCADLVQSLPGLERLGMDNIGHRFKVYRVKASKPTNYQIVILASAFVELNVGADTRHYNFGEA